MNNTDAVTQGVHHVGLTVRNIEETGQFFKDILKYAQVGAIPDYPAVILSDGIGRITLWQVQDPSRAGPFNHKRVVGLHHLALKVAADDLDMLCTRLRETEGVSIEFEPELLGEGPTRHMMFFIPGGIRMELIAPGS
jgi:catechol 2,3-dioxygenase-like lactoylglutathione lyase family enzyme